MFITLVVSIAAAATVEVRPGDDIVTLTASPGAGSEIVFGDGTYEITQPLEWTGVGTEAEPIVLRAADGATPVIEGYGAWILARIGHDDAPAEHIVVRGLTFRG